MFKAGLIMRSRVHRLLLKIYLELSCELHYWGGT